MTETKTVSLKMDKNSVTVILAIIALLGTMYGQFVGNPQFMDQYTKTFNDLQAQLQVTWNPTFYTLQKQASYIIDDLTSGAKTYYTLQNGDTGKLNYYSTVAWKTFQFGFANVSLGGKIFVKAGDYPINDTLLPYSNLILEGEGNSTFIYASKTGFHLFQFTAKTNILIRDIALAQNASETTYSTVNIDTASTLNTLDNIAFWGGGFDCVVDCGNSTTVTNCHFMVFNDCGIHAFTGCWAPKYTYNYFTGGPARSSGLGDGILSEAGSGFDGLVEGNEFDHINITNMESHALYWEANNTRIVNNYFHDNIGTGGMVRLGTGAAGCLFEGNMLRNVLGNAVTSDAWNSAGSTANAFNNRIENNILYNVTAWGIVLRGPAVGYGYSGTVVTGNVLELVEIVGLILDSDSGVEITNNIFVKCGAAYAAIRLSTERANVTNVRIAHNIFRDCPVYSVALTADGFYCNNVTIESNTFINDNIAVKIHAGCQENFVQLNMFAVNVTTKVDDAGSLEVVRWNTGWKTEASGSNATAADSQTQQHGLVAAPVLGYVTSMNTTACIAGASAFAAATFTYDLKSDAGVAMTGQTVCWYMQTWAYP